MLKAYGAWGPKKMAGRESEGSYRITYRIAENGAIFQAYPKVKPPGHAQQILADWST